MRDVMNGLGYFMNAALKSVTSSSSRDQEISLRVIQTGQSSLKSLTYPVYLKVQCFVKERAQQQLHLHLHLAVAIRARRSAWTPTTTKKKNNNNKKIKHKNVCQFWSLSTPPPQPPSAAKTEVCVGECVYSLLFCHSPVEVQVAQVLGWFLRGTHFLIVKDNPPVKESGGRKIVRMNMAAQKYTTLIIYYTNLKVEEMEGFHSLLVLFDVADVVTTHCARAHVTDKSEELVLCRTKQIRFNCYLWKKAGMHRTAIPNTSFCPQHKQQKVLIHLEACWIADLKQYTALFRPQTHTPTDFCGHVVNQSYWSVQIRAKPLIQWRVVWVVQSKYCLCPFSLHSGALVGL